VAFFLLLLWTVNIFLLYVKLGKQKLLQLWRYILSYLICFLCVWLSKRFIDSFVHNPNQAPAHLYAIFILGFILNSVVLIVQDIIILKDKKSKVELENAELKIKNVEATNRQLKEQIHPHFLFNSLSTLKTLITRNPQQAEDYLVKLSDFLRAAISSTTLNTIQLEEELKLCLDYLDMQKMRFDQSLRYTIDIPPVIRTTSFVPAFSILPLLENAIKHNKFTREQPLDIVIDCEGDRLIVSNNVSPKKLLEQSTGLGLENLAERYKLLANDMIRVNNDGNTFYVSIKLLNDEGSHHRR
jgi:LytS/YehU family sensor histidine kinase